MNLSAKIAVLLICAAICAIGFLPRHEKREHAPTHNAVTPAQLSQKPKPNWLLV